MARQQILGVCQYCQAKKSMAAMAGHIKECHPAHQGSGATALAAVVLLRVTAPSIEPYWLDLAVKPNTQLKEVDRFLKKNMVGMLWPYESVPSSTTQEGSDGYERG